MKILSIDIGIKNLAYCLLEVTITDNIKNYNIIKWNVINLCGEIPTCQHIIKTKKTSKKCDKKACLFRGDVFYCKTHAKKMNCILDTKENSIKKSTSLKDLQTLSTKYNIPYDSRSKKVELYDKLKQHFDENMFYTIKKKSASDMSLIDVGCSIYKNIPLHLNLEKYRYRNY